MDTRADVRSIVFDSDGLPKRKWFHVKIIFSCSSYREGIYINVFSLAFYYLQLFTKRVLVEFLCSFCDLSRLSQNWLHLFLYKCGLIVKNLTDYSGSDIGSMSALV